MARFRKKPVVIEAIRWDGTDQALAALRNWGLSSWEGAGSDRSLAIHTLEGTMVASMGDWVIRGVKGELYPCKPDIFAETYVPVEE